MTKVTANDITIEVEDYGNKDDPVILLIMGLAAQLTFWPEDFVQSLVDGGYRVVKFDNRDIGLSHKYDNVKAPNPVWQIFVKKFLPSRKMAPYSLTDMAGDAVGVMDALGIEQAHVVGVSMGGMISQILAAEYPERVRTLIPVMTSTNAPGLPGAAPHVQKALFRLTSNRPTETEAAIARGIEVFTLIGSPAGSRDRDALEQLVRQSVERSNYPQGPKRQLAAIIGTGNLSDWSKRVQAPTLVIHGKADPLVPYQCGEDVAAKIPGAKLELIDDMGHDMPPSKLDRITKLVLDHIGT